MLHKIANLNNSKITQNSTYIRQNNNKFNSFRRNKCKWEKQIILLDQTKVKLEIFN
jgi:hypothetical protein